MLNVGQGRTGFYITGISPDLLDLLYEGARLAVLKRHQMAQERGPLSIGPDGEGIGMVQAIIRVEATDAEVINDVRLLCNRIREHQQ